MPIAMKLIKITIAFLLLFSLQAKSQSFKNPILSGFYPDPSICKAGDDYYMVVSSFAYYPGLPLFHSKDLLNWKQIGSVLNRPEQLNLDSAGVSRGLFAPSISYHKGTFYIICTIVDRGGNFVVTTKNPMEGWTNPVWLPEINGIDPSLFFDNDDKAYIVYNSIPPNNISIHNGHRTIRINAFDYKALKVASDNKVIVNGGTDMAKKPVWIEAPHIIKKDDWYYLICAEGGTGYNHSEVAFRTKSLTDPFVPFENNPILTQRNLNPARKNPVTTTGHADLVEGPNGKWWGVFLGCRPYADDYYNTGRETFMAPVEWKDGWPVFNLGGEDVKYTYPISSKVNKTLPALNGNYYFRDDFKNNEINNRYSFLRTVKNMWYSINGGKLNMQLQPHTCSSLGNPSFVGFRQSHLKGYAATNFSFKGVNENEQAGLLVFQNELHYYFLAKSIKEGKPVVQLFKGAGNKATDKKPVLVDEIFLQSGNTAHIYFKVATNGDSYSFFYATEKDKWNLLKTVDAKFLSTKEAGGFVGCFYALYATSNGQLSSAKALYNWFECKSMDEVY
jgi:xylan 1,4-beta-xylosidase